MAILPKRWEQWAYGLVGGCIGGGAQSVTTWMGMTAARAIGVNVPQLNFKALGVIFLTGVVTHGFAFLAKSPLLPPSSGDTEKYIIPGSQRDKYPRK